ncbi:hypothetical protein ACHAAC_11820 [Aeromicrobium sp. CF4.19]
MKTRRLLAVVPVLALAGFLALLEPDEADGPTHESALVTAALR